MRRKPLLFAAALLLIGCGAGMLALSFSNHPRGVSNEEARKLVEQFNKAVCEAYRRCDITLIDSVVGMNTTEGNRLTGLIGADRKSVV